MAARVLAKVPLFATDTTEVFDLGMYEVRHDKLHAYSYIELHGHPTMWFALPRELGMVSDRNELKLKLDLMYGVPAPGVELHTSERIKPGQPSMKDFDFHYVGDYIDAECAKRYIASIRWK